MRYDEIVKNKNKILEWCFSNVSITEIAKRLECSRNTLYRCLKDLNIDYTGIQGGRGPNKRTAEEDMNYGADSLHDSDIVRILTDSKTKEWKCEKCGRTEWLGCKIPLVLDRIDGDSYNNDVGNLRLICCNCKAVDKKIMIS